MNATRFAAWPVISFLLYCAASRALACACCSDEGQYLVEENVKPSDLQVAEMSHFKFASTAHLFVGPGDLENVKGVREPSYDYVLEAAFDEVAKEWRFAFRSEQGSAGVLWVPIKTSKASTSAIDIHDGMKSAGGGPSVYKEWKFRGRVRGDGIFKSGLAAPATYTLIFQGRGNNCDAAFDFSHWRLAVTGRNATFVFVGKFIGDEAVEPAATPEESPREE